MNDMTKKQIQSDGTSVAETAKKLHEDLQTVGHYDSARLKRVFGDPRKSAGATATDALCSAYLGRQARVQ